MAHRTDALTEQQRAILKWIGDGCPADVMPDDSHRISAAALRRRGLVRITGRGPTWAAHLTTAGREWIAGSESDDAPAPRQANVSVTQQLVDDVTAAGGSLRVPQHRAWEKGSIDFRRRAELAQTYGKVPAGKALIVSNATADWLQIDLVDAFGGHASELQPVRVPQRVGKHHPLVRQFRDRSAQHEVSRAALPRVLRILHALVQEAENRGYKIALVEGRDTRTVRAPSGWRGHAATRMAWTHCASRPRRRPSRRRCGPTSSSRSSRAGRPTALNIIEAGGSWRGDSKVRTVPLRRGCRISPREVVASATVGECRRKNVACPGFSPLKDRRAKVPEAPVPLAVDATRCRATYATA